MKPVLIATSVGPDHDAAQAERRRTALREFMTKRGLRAHPWATSAGIASGTLYAFLKADTDALTTPILDKLAAAAGVPISVLIGEGDEPAIMPAVVRYVMRSAVLTRLGRPMRRNVQLPPSPAGTTWEIAEVQGDAVSVLRQGALIYWRTDGNPSPAANEGRICICVLDDETMHLADLRRGFNRTWLLATAAGQIVDGCHVTAAYPLEWVKTPD